MTSRGLRTWLPKDVKKQEFATNKLTSLYSSWGYEPIIIPTLVDEEVLKQSNSKVQGKAFKIPDKSGDILFLRPELTQPIAREITSRYQELELPVRLYYSSSVFRYSGRATDESREMQQVGIEQLGLKENQKFSDLEVMHLFTESVRELKLRNYIITISHSKIWEKIFQDFDNANEAFKLLEQGNILALKKTIGTNSPLNCLLQTNNIEEVEQKLSIDLSEIKEIQKEFPNSNIVFDPSICPDMNLYTGIRFNLMVDGEGDTVAVGGRYDNLCKSFGADLPAIGFAFYVPRLISALQFQNLLEDSNDKSQEVQASSTWQETLEQVTQAINKGNKAKIT